jgi:hypothetical protein
MFGHYGENGKGAASVALKAGDTATDGPIGVGLREESGDGFAGAIGRVFREIIYVYDCCTSASRAVSIQGLLSAYGPFEGGEAPTTDHTLAPSSTHISAFASCRRKRHPSSRDCPVGLSPPLQLLPPPPSTGYS